MPEAATPPAEAIRKARSRLPLILVLIAAAGICVYGWWVFFMKGKVFTEDAYVMAQSARVSARVAGTVTGVFVDDDHAVKTGDTLFRLDPRDYEAVVAEKRGILAQTLAEITGGEQTLSLTDATTTAQLAAGEAALAAAGTRRDEAAHRIAELEKRHAAAAAEAENARRDSERYTGLFATGATSQQQRDRFATTSRKAQADLAAVAAETAATRSALETAKKEIERTQAQLEATRADRERVAIQKSRIEALRGQAEKDRGILAAAELNLSYCTVRAPISGYIAQRHVQVGDRVSPGQPLMAVVPLSEVYIEANYKETKLKNVRLGQPVTLTADVYPDFTFRGKVAGIRAGTGAAFSLLPPENATGNWIKVVQRVPVRIELDAPPSLDHPLRLGLSMQVTITTSDRSGLLLLPQKP